MPAVDIKAIETLVQPVLQGLGYEFVDLEWKHEAGRWLLRVFMDKDGGVAHEDCSHASHALSAELDVADLIHTPYNLEVSSPGLDRPLKRAEDFRRFAGRKAKVRTRQPVETGEPVARRNFSGKLLGIDDRGAKLRIDVDGRVFEIPVDQVEKANLQYEV